MNPPFTIEEFLGVFEKYNLAVWPMQIVLYALGILALFFAIKNIWRSDRIISAILAFFLALDRCGLSPDIFHSD